MTYFVIRCTEDGTSVTSTSAEQLLKKITPDETGQTEYGPSLVFLDSVPAFDKGFWYGVPENAILIIRGEVVIPKTVEVVRRLEL